MKAARAQLPSRAGTVSVYVCVDVALGMVNSDLAGISKGNYWNKTLIRFGGSFWSTEVFMYVQSSFGIQVIPFRCNGE